MTLDENSDRENGLASGRHTAATYGVRPGDAQRFYRNNMGAQPDAYLAGYVDALLDHVQTREELAPGCYRIRPVKGAE